MVTPGKHFLEVHLGHAACCGLAVVVVVRVNDHAVEHALHLDLHLVKQQIQFPGLDEVGNIYDLLKKSHILSSGCVPSDGTEYLFIIHIILCFGEKYTYLGMKERVILPLNFCHLYAVFLTYLDLLLMREGLGTIVQKTCYKSLLNISAVIKGHAGCSIGYT